MSGDFSRDTFNPAKHYSGVLKQQGRVQVDADDNEQLSIQHHRDETEAIDVIGQSGVPKKKNGFKIGVANGNRDLTISAGRYYVDGLLCELNDAASYTSQPYFPNPDQTAPINNSPNRQINLSDGHYLVFLDAWKREITALDDDTIREVALNGPDTAIRLQNVWQVRLVQVGPLSPAMTCKSEMPAYEQLTRGSSGKLSAQTQPPQPEESACLLPPLTGYNRLENQLYRVEVHTGGAKNQTRFKWSRDNASVETTITNISGSVLTVADRGKDEILNFSPGNWVEIVTTEATLKGIPNPLTLIDSIGPGPNEITLANSAAAFANTSGLKLRRWDQSLAGANADGVSANVSGWIDLEGGIQVKFEGGTYRAGDYWLIPARTATGRIEWPTDSANDPIPQAPKGIQHHFCPLALVKSSGNQLSLVADCRKPFPSLTEICADDVCFDNTTCDFQGAKTVQDALDMLCRRHEVGQCTFVITPGENVQKVFDSIRGNGDAEVCFQAGTYELPDTVTVEGKGNLKISGAGFGTRLIAPKSEAALRFVKCKSILIRDLFAETDVADEKGNAFGGLNGTLTMLDCDLVNVESVGLKCAPAPFRAATCITVTNRKISGTARIEHCVLEVGQQQTGILLVSVARVQVEHNVIRTDQTRKLSPSQLLEDKHNRASLRSVLIAEARLGEVPGKKDKSNVKVAVANQTIQFRSERSIKKAWDELLKTNPPPTGIDSTRGLLRHVVGLADRIVKDVDFRKRFKAFASIVDPILEEKNVVGSQGITVGGDSGATEVRIINNTIEGMLQGIHVGLSKRERRIDKRKGVRPLSAQFVTISGNTITIVLSPLAMKQDRHAIFVGNCESLLIENNHARLQRLPKADDLEIEGIRVWGELGKRILVNQNYVSSTVDMRERSFNIGILVHPLNNIDSSSLWRVSFNVAPSKQQSVRVSNGVKVDTNVP